MGKIVEENLLDNQYNYRIEFKAIVFSTVRTRKPQTVYHSNEWSRF